MAASQVRACIDRKVEQLWRSEHHDHDGPAPRGALSDERLRAQAMIELSRSGHAAPDGTRAPADVLVLIDYQTLLGQLSLAGRCELGDGTPLPASEVRRLACEARIIPVLMGGGSLPLDVGRSRRLATGAERAGARAVHDTCCIDGCDTPFDYCELHHIRWWGNGGRSDLANLAPVCSKHHHLIHDHGWELRLDRQRLGTLHRGGATAGRAGANGEADATPDPRANAEAVPAEQPPQPSASDRRALSGSAPSPPSAPDTARSRSAPPPADFDAPSAGAGRPVGSARCPSNC